MKKKKKILALFLVLCMMLTSFVGCSNNSEPLNNNEDNSTSKNEEDNSTSKNEEDKSETSKEPEYTGEKILYLVTGGQLASMNAISDGEDFYDGRIDVNGSLVTLMAKKDGSGIEFVPNHAEALPTSEDGKTFIVKTRKDLKWTDGTPINAKTYEYSLKMTLDPKLVNGGANELISGSSVVKNAKAYYTGECKWEDVGVKVIDEYTLEIALEYTCTDIDFWKSLCSIPPAHEALYEAGMNSDRTSTTYGNTLENIPSAGAFRVTEWVLDQKLVFKKNEGYPLSDYFNIDGIVIYLSNDSTAATQMFLKGETDSMNISMNNYDEYKEDPRVLDVEGNVFWGLWLNDDSEDCPALGNNDFRRALYYVVPRESIAKDILKINKPASFYVSKASFVGDPMSADAKKYRDTEAAKDVINNDEIAYNEELAKEYFDKAYVALGNQKITLEVQYFETSEAYRNVLEVLQETCSKIFGSDKIEIVMKAVPPINVYQNLKDKNFQASFAANTVSVFNPWDSFKNFRSDYEGRRHTWGNDEFDKLQFDTTKGDLLLNPEKRIEALAQMEKILIEGVPYVPFFTNDGAKIYSDRIKLITDECLPEIGHAFFQCDITGEQKPFK